MNPILPNPFFKKLNVTSASKALLLTILFFSAFKVQAIEISISPNQNNILYVDAATDGDGSGSSWGNAIPDLATAMKWADQNYNMTWADVPLKIFVAKGVYKPAFSPEDGKGFEDDNRRNSFLLVNNVHVYGGFDPSNGIVDLTHPRLLQSAGDTEGSILSGNIGAENLDNDNAYHVVVSSGLANNAILDGFGITEGESYQEVSYLVNGNQIFDCSGGGIYSSISSPILRNLYIYNNNVGESGGGYFGYRSSPQMTNIWFENNSASHGGGLANQFESSPILINSRFNGNSGIGNAIYNVDSSAPTFVNLTVVENSYAIVNDKLALPTINNSIIIGGVGGNASFIANYSLIEGNVGGENGNIDGTDIVLTDVFLDYDNSEFSLKTKSVAINAGSNNLYLETLSAELDLVRNPRLFDTTIDLGALEFQDISLPLNLLSFEGKKNNQGLLLEWTTTNEVNFQRFEIEKMDVNQIFIKVDYVLGKGNGNYEFIDRNASVGINYYRLKQIDNDGTFAYSKTIAVDLSLNTNEISIYPAPAINYINVLNGQGTLSIFNNAGQVLKTVKVLDNSKTTINISNLANGVYTLLFVKSDGKSVFKKVLVSR